MVCPAEWQIGPRSMTCQTIGVGEQVGCSASEEVDQIKGRFSGILRGSGGDAGGPGVQSGKPDLESATAQFQWRRDGLSNAETDHDKPQPSAAN